MKNFFTLFTLLFIPLIVTLFVQCNEPVIEPVDQETALSLNKGEEEPTAGNNLSFPAFLADGFNLNPIVAPLFTSAYTGPYDGLSAEELAIATSSTWYAQKVEGNVWQADYVTTEELQNVTFIDWGDNIESINAKIFRPFRLEVTLYKDVASSPMTGYNMAVLAYPSSPDEVQGTNNVTYESNWATVASNNAKIVVQKFEGDGSTLSWNGEKWENAADAEVGFGFAVELNVGGKLIFGASQGGWVPAQIGNYRITFYIPDSNVNISGAQIGNYGNPPVYPSIARLRQPVVNGTHNISYVDVLVVDEGGKKK